MTHTTPLLGTLAALLLSTAAAAAPAQPVAPVRFGDLDLHSARGQQTARDRIRQSAREACADLGKGGGDELNCRAALEFRLKGQLDRATAGAANRS